MTAQTNHWTYKPTPEDGVRDAEGYMREPERKFDESTWSGRQVKKLHEANEKVAENQRRMGYQVYRGDPGQNPHYITHWEQNQISKPLYDSFCAIL